MHQSFVEKQYIHFGSDIMMMYHYRMSSEQKAGIMPYEKNPKSRINPNSLILISDINSFCSLKRNPHTVSESCEIRQRTHTHTDVNHTQKEWRSEEEGNEEGMRQAPCEYMQKPRERNSEK